MLKNLDTASPTPATGGLVGHLTPLLSKYVFNYKLHLSLMYRMSLMYRDKRSQEAGVEPTLSSGATELDPPCRWLVDSPLLSAS